MKLKKSLAILLAFAMVMGVISSNFAEPTEDFHIEESTTEGAKGPEVIEEMVYKEDKKIEPGSLSGDVNLSTVGKGLYFDGTDFYFFLDTGIMASNYMFNIEGDRFFFGEDGKMVKNQMITYDGEMYYFDVNGAMYKNRWYTAEEIDTYENTITYTDYYFGPTGRAYRAGDNSTGLVLKTIDGDKYGFNSDGEKVEGYYDHNGTKYDPDEVEAYANAEYYFDPQSNGAAVTGWHYYSGATRGSEYEDKEEIVLYFDERTCKKVKSNSSDETRAISRTIEGQRYMFDYNGVRKNKWYTTDSSGRLASHSNARYFSEEYDGYMSKGWFTAIPPENAILEVNRLKHNSDEEVWYYAASNGNILKKCIRKIGNFIYAFDDDGVMQSGCMVRVKNGAFIKSYSTDYLYRANVMLDYTEYGDAEEGKDPTSNPTSLNKEKGLLRVADGEQWMYFLADEKGDNREGSMAQINTSFKISLNDNDIYFIANSTGGYSLTTDLPAVGKVASVATRNNKLIQNGCLLTPKADENNYGVVRMDVDKVTNHSVINWKNKVVSPLSVYRYVVVNSSGTQVTTQYRCVKDKEQNYIYYGIKGEFLGVFSCQGVAEIAKSQFSYTHTNADGSTEVISVPAGQFYWKHKADKKWVYGLPPESYRCDSTYLWLNFNATGFSKGPYEDGAAAYIYKDTP